MENHIVPQQAMFKLISHAFLDTKIFFWTFVFLGISTRDNEKLHFFHVLRAVNNVSEVENGHISIPGWSPINSLQDKNNRMVIAHLYRIHRPTEEKNTWISGGMLFFANVWYIYQTFAKIRGPPEIQVFFSSVGWYIGADEVSACG